MSAQLTDSSEELDLKKAWHILHQLKPKCPGCGYSHNDLFLIQRPEYYSYSSYLSTPGTDDDYNLYTGDQVDLPTLHIEWGNGDWCDAGEEEFTCRQCGRNLDHYLSELMEKHDLEVDNG